MTASLQGAPEGLNLSSDTNPSRAQVQYWFNDPVLSQMESRLWAVGRPAQEVHYRLSHSRKPETRARLMAVKIPLDRAYRHLQAQQEQLREIVRARFMQTGHYVTETLDQLLTQLEQVAPLDIFPERPC
ncbi:MAG: hypothetical protein ACHQX0_06245 [Desulfobaccales bacterium]